MFAFVVERLVHALGVMLAVALVAFCLTNLVGDPVANLLPESAGPAERAALAAQLGLDRPLLAQAARFVWNAAQAEFGLSWRNLEPVAGLLATRLPATLELATVAMILALLVGIPAGVYTALNRDRPLARLIQAGSLIGISLPSFLTGIVLILLFAVELRWFAASGRGETVVLFGWWTTGLGTETGLRALVLPAVTLALFQATLVMRLVRSEMLEVLRTDFIRFARARGLTDRAVHFGHALKNTLVPVLTIVGLQLGSVIAFAIVTETVFQWPGLGLLLIQAITFGDMPVLAAYLILVSAMFVAINLMVDLLYRLVDPRVRIDRARALG
jgi:peptide/nickel transport system permease protein